MLTIVISMAGKGKRFYQAGYEMPKFEIIAHGKTLFFWSMSSLKSFINADCEFIFVTLKENQSTNFINLQCNILGIANFKILELNELTDGQATSVYLSKKLWHPTTELLIYNIDTYINPGILSISLIPKGSQGWIPCVDVPGNHWSFAAINEEGWLIGIEEKKRISNNCSIGLYWFNDAMDYVNAYDTFYQSVSNLINGERYIAPLYKEMVEAKKLISISLLDKKEVFFLGTPLELDNFKAIHFSHLPKY